MTSLMLDETRSAPHRVAVMLAADAAVYAELTAELARHDPALVVTVARGSSMARRLGRMGVGRCVRYATSPYSASAAPVATSHAPRSGSGLRSGGTSRSANSSPTSGR